MQTQTSAIKSNAQFKNSAFVGKKRNTIVKTVSKAKKLEGDTRVQKASQKIRIVSMGKSSEMVDLIVSKSKYGRIKALSKETTENAYFENF